MESAVPFLENHFCCCNHNMSNSSGSGGGGIGGSPAAVAEEAQPLDRAGDRGRKRGQVLAAVCAGFQVKTRKTARGKDVGKNDLCGWSNKNAYTHMRAHTQTRTHTHSHKSFFSIF